MSSRGALCWLLIFSLLSGCATNREAGSGENTHVTPLIAREQALRPPAILRPTLAVHRLTERQRGEPATVAKAYVASIEQLIAYSAELERWIAYLYGDAPAPTTATEHGP